MISMNRPLRGERASAATTRYVGCFFLPIRMRRSFTATWFLFLFTKSNRSVRQSRPAIVPAGGGSVPSRELQLVLRPLGKRGHALRRSPPALLVLASLRALLAALGHELLHHALHVLELLEQGVDLGRAGAAALGDPQPTGTVDG